MLWCMQELRDLEGFHEARRGAGFLCQFAGADLRRPLGIFSNLPELQRDLRLGWPTFSQARSCSSTQALPKTCPCKTAHLPVVGIFSDCTPLEDAADEFGFGREVTLSPNSNLPKKDKKIKIIIINDKNKRIGPLPGRRGEQTQTPNKLPIWERWWGREGGNYLPKPKPKPLPLYFFFFPFFHFFVFSSQPIFHFFSFFKFYFFCFHFLCFVNIVVMLVDRAHS